MRQIETFSANKITDEKQATSGTGSTGKVSKVRSLLSMNRVVTGASYSSDVYT